MWVLFSLHFWKDGTLTHMIMLVNRLKKTILIFQLYKIYKSSDKNVSHANNQTLGSCFTSRMRKDYSRKMLTHYNSASEPIVKLTLQ